MNKKQNGIVKLLYTQNPFYLIGTALLLFAIQFSGSAETSISHQPLVLASVLCGMIFIMAIVAVAIIKFGGVWDDARTILLSIMLLFIGVATSCDTLIYSDPVLATSILACVFIFLLMVWECVIRILKIWFPVDVRVPFYVLLAIGLFYSLFFTQQFAAISTTWKLYAFGWIGAAGLLLCLPAIWQGKSMFRETGTPWRWPLYPWSIFAVLLIALCLRFVLLSLSFYPGLGFSSPLGIYFFAPIVFACLVLVRESTLDPKDKKYGGGSGWVLFISALCSLPTQGFGLYIEFNSEIAARLASPFWLVLAVNLVYAATLWLRGYSGSRLAIGMTLILFTMTRPIDLIPTFEIHSILPLLGLAGICAISAFKNNSTVGWCLAIGFLTIAVWDWSEPLGFQRQVLCVVSSSWLMLLVIGASLSDLNAKRIRVVVIATGYLLATLALLAVFGQQLDPELAAGFVCTLYVLQLMAWLLSQWKFFGSLTVGMPILAALAFTGIPLESFEWSLDWRRAGILYGAVGSFGMAFLISSFKAGWLKSFLAGWTNEIRALKMELQLGIKDGQILSNQSEI